MGKTKSPKQKTEKKSQQQQVTKKKSFKEKVKLSQQYQSKHKITKKKSNIKTTTNASFKSSLNKKQNPSTTTITRTGGTNINEKKDKSKGLSNLQQSFQKKLEGARFRVINERLYTSRGHEAFEEFQRNKTLFDIVSILFLLFVDGYHTMSTRLVKKFAIIVHEKNYIML